jgi:hypothetical protein
LTEEQQAKINEITGFLTGKASSSFGQPAQASSEDFEFEDSFATTGASKPSTSSSSTDEDDFFSDFN